LGACLFVTWLASYLEVQDLAKAEDIRRRRPLIKASMDIYPWRSVVTASHALERAGRAFGFRVEVETKVAEIGASPA